MNPVVHTGMERMYFIHTGKFVNHAGRWGEYVDRAFGVGQHAAFLGGKIAEIRGDTAGAKKCQSVSDAFGAADSTLGVVRALPVFEKFATGKAIWAQDSDGLWERDEEGGYVRRHLLDIVIDILCLAGRVLAPVTWFHKQGVYDLGKHSDRMTHAIFGIWGAVISLDMVNNIRQMVDENDTTVLKRLIADTVCDFLDLVALPFDFGFGMSGHPALAITGASLNIVAKGGFLIKEALLY